MLNKSQKLLLLTLVFDVKDHLFAKFSPLVTRESKRAKWQAILEKLQDAGADVHSVESLRDIHYSNVVRSTKNKLDTNRATGSGGNVKFTELDEWVIKILGDKNASLNPLPIEGSPVIFHGVNEPRIILPPPTSTDGNKESNANDPNITNEGGPVELPLDGPSVSTRRRGRTVPSMPVSTNSVNEELSNLRKRKLELECEKLKLEIKKLKREVGENDN